MRPRSSSHGRLPRPQRCPAGRDRNRTIRGPARPTPISCDLTCTGARTSGRPPSTLIVAARDPPGRLLLPRSSAPPEFDSGLVAAPEGSLRNRRRAARHDVSGGRPREPVVAKISQSDKTARRRLRRDARRRPPVPRGFGWRRWLVHLEGIGLPDGGAETGPDGDRPALESTPA